MEDSSSKNSDFEALRSKVKLALENKAGWRESPLSRLAQEEEKALSDSAIADRELARLHSSEDLEEKRANRSMRQIAAMCVFGFMCVWSVFLWGLIFWVGYKNSFIYDSKVLITLIGGSSVSVIGLVGFVIKGLFGNGSPAPGGPKS